MSHFNEPWYVSDDCVLDASGKWVAVIHVDVADSTLMDSLQLCERIAACVNLCAGVSTEELLSDAAHLIVSRHGIFDEIDP